MVLRDTTERPEGIDAGTLKLAGTDEDTIFNLANELLSVKEAHDKMAKAQILMGMEKHPAELQMQL